MKPINMIFIAIWLAALALNIALYFYRKRIIKKRKEGVFLKAGVQMWRTITHGPKGLAWWYYFGEDILERAVFPAILGFATGAVGIFLIFFSLSFAGAVFKLYGTRYFFIPYAYTRKGMWSFSCFNLYYVRGFGAFILAALAGAGFFGLLGEIFEKNPIFFSEPTAIARFVERAEVPVWILVTLVVLILIPAIINVFYLWFKITPLFTRYYLEYDNEVLRLYSRFSRREIAKIDFKKPYSYEKAVDYRSIKIIFLNSFDIHIFAQDNKAVAISESLYGSAKESGDKSRKIGPWMLWAKLPGEVTTTYEVTPEECGNELFEIIKKHKKKTQYTYDRLS